MQHCTQVCVALCKAERQGETADCECAEGPRRHCAFRNHARETRPVSKPPWGQPTSLDDAHTPPLRDGRTNWFSESRGFLISRDAMDTLNAPRGARCPVFSATFQRPLAVFKISRVIGRGAGPAEAFRALSRVAARATSLKGFKENGHVAERADPELLVSRLINN